MDSELIAEIERLVRSVGNELLSLWPAKTSRVLQVSLKSDGSPVTEADLLAHNMLSEGLKKLFPDDSIISEESEGSKVIDGARSTWIIDPLDGTRSYIAGKNDFSILIARCQNGIASFGVMHFPANDSFVSALKGKGAFINGVKTNVSSAATLQAERVYCNCKNLREEIDSSLPHESLDAGRIFLGVARNEFDGAIIKLSKFGAHDFAAASVIIEEAGGSFSDETGRKDIFHKDIKPKYILASNRLLHADLKKMVSL